MPKKNAFFYFMLEYKACQEAKGRKFKNIAEVTPFAGEIWQKMDAAQRERYLLMATQTQKKVHVEENVVEHAQRKDAAKDLLQERVKKAESRNELAKEVFYLISMGYFCRTIDDVYYPAEIGAIKYSLKFGVMERFHLIVDHAKLPTGLAYEALQQSEDTHALPIPPHGLGVKDYAEIAQKLLTFLQAEEEIPMLFTAAKEASAVYSMLSDILGEHLHYRPLTIGSVAELYMQLQHASARCNQDKAAFKTVHYAQKFLDDDRFSYTEGISCDYHEYRSLLTHCVLSQCIRWAYSISHECCVDMGIALIPGMHMPHQKDIEHQFNDSSETVSDDHASSDNEQLNDGNMSFVSYGTHITNLPAEPGTIDDLPINIRTDGPEGEQANVTSNQVLVGQQNTPLKEGIVEKMGRLNLKEPGKQSYRLTPRGNALINGDGDAFSFGLTISSGREFTRCPKCFYRFDRSSNE